jgi:7,8-dihydro-6-hydroxymethylpterin-pyrophosphokinase
LKIGEINLIIIIDNSTNNIALNLPSPSPELRHFVITSFVIANPAGMNPTGARQSSANLEKIASSGKERPPRNNCDKSQG